MKYHVCDVRWTLRLTLLRSWKQAQTQWISHLSQTMWDTLRKLPLSPKIQVSTITVSPLILNTLNLETGLTLLSVRNIPFPISGISGYVELSSQEYRAWPDCVDMCTVLTLYWWKKNKLFFNRYWCFYNSECLYALCMKWHITAPVLLSLLEFNHSWITGLLVGLCFKDSMWLWLPVNILSAYGLSSICQWILLLRNRLIKLKILSEHCHCFLFCKFNLLTCDRDVMSCPLNYLSRASSRTLRWPTNIIEL